MMGETVVVDSRGRVTLPREVRSALGVRPGDRLRVSTRGDRIVLEKVEDPFETLERLLGGLRFDREARRRAGEAAIEEAARRWGVAREGPGGD